MARGDKIKATDIMPRHLHRTGEFAAAITVPAGATLADARRQLVLRAFASTNGDYARTADGTGNYEYAIDMMLQGLGVDPDARAAHQTLRDIALKRKASGGKDLHSIIQDLARALDPDERLQEAQAATGQDEPSAVAIKAAVDRLAGAAARRHLRLCARGTRMATGLCSSTRRRSRSAQAFA